MPYRAQIDDHGVVTRYKDSDTGEVISAKEYERRLMTQQGQYVMAPGQNRLPQMQSAPSSSYNSAPYSPYANSSAMPNTVLNSAQPQQPSYSNMASQQPLNSQNQSPMPMSGMSTYPDAQMQNALPNTLPNASSANMQNNPLIQPGAQILNNDQQTSAANPQLPGQATSSSSQIALGQAPSSDTGQAPSSMGVQGKNLRMEGIPRHQNTSSVGYRTHGFLDATSIAILLPTLVLLALIIAAAHKKRLFPWQTIRTFNPPSGLMTPRDYERSFVCPPNLRRHGRLGKRNPEATWGDADGIVIPFGFLARTHLPITIPLGRLPNKNMFIVAPSGSGKTTLMRAVMKALLAKPCVIIALEAKANDPNLDERKEGFKYTILPEASQAGFETLYFNPLDQDSIHWNPLDISPVEFASSIVQDVNSLPPEEQHWAERDHGYIYGLSTLLKWGAVMVAGEDENGQPAEVHELPCNPRGLMRLVNNRRNIVESIRRLKTNPDVDPAELTELTQMLSSIIRTDTDWDKNIQGVRGRLRMFKNPNVLRCTEQSNVDLRGSMHKATVLIFGAPASLGPDAESLASCFVYQLQQALHTRYGTASVLPLFAFFDEYQTLNIDLAGRLSAIVRGANGGLTVILQNISQISRNTSGSDPASSGTSELKTIFSNSALRICLHNADETTAKFFADEIGKHAIVVPGISDHYESNGFGIFPTSWNRIHSQQVVSRVDTDSIKRMEKHHALVYMAPAGDPEFGENKPFMCDLRGIEEIARLHLLHNVAGRPTPPDPNTPDIPPGFASGPSLTFDSHLNSNLNDAPMPSEPESENIPESGNINVSPPADEQANIAGDSALAAFMQVQSLPGMASMPAMNQNANYSADPNKRTCPHCKQIAGKGRFCIECGKFIGQTTEVNTQAISSENKLSSNHKIPNNVDFFEAHQNSVNKTENKSENLAPMSNEAQASIAAMFGPASTKVDDGDTNQKPPFPYANQINSMAESIMAAADEISQPKSGASKPPVTSLTPDLSKFGLANNETKSTTQNNIEF
jgi:hypothetical protein